MKPGRNLLLPAVLVMIPIAALGWPADEVRVTGFITTAKQDCPLQILGFKLPEKVGYRATLIVRNVSSRNISDFTVQFVTGNPDLSSAADNVSAPISGGPLVGRPRSSFMNLPRSRKEQSIPSGVQVEIREGGLVSGDFVTAARFLRSNCVHSLAIVDRVEFADGTDWKWSLSDEQLRQIWKESILPESLKSCANSPEVLQFMERLRGESYIMVGSPSQADTGIVKHYSIACTLRPRHGEMFALCPM